MFKVYGDVLSGNCYKVKLALEQLNKPYEWVAVDIMKKETQSNTFLSLNPNGKVPTLELSDGKTLAESNAILFYLAKDTPLLPEDTYAKSLVLQWMFFEQYSHEPYVAVARFIKLYLGNSANKQGELKAKIEKGNKALRVMDEHLAGKDFFVGESYSIADIALFAYTHVAEDGGFSLSDFPNIVAWVERVKAQKNYVTIG